MYQEGLILLLQEEENMRMVNSKVLVKLVEETKEHNGLILVDKKEPIVLAEVLNVPSDEKEIRVGDRVLVPVDRIAKIAQGHLVERKDILAVVEE